MAIRHWQPVPAVCFGLIFAGFLAAQSDVPADQCLGGWVVSIQPDSLILKFNDKINTIHLAPGAELWRRGKDVDHLQQFMLGDEIYTRCTRAADGSVVASIIAAVEDNDAVDLKPHHIVEITVCAGRLIAIARDSLTVKNDAGTCTASVPTNTEIWRGETFHDTSALRLGDDVGIRCSVGYPGRVLTAESVEANVDKAEGTVVEVRADRILVKEDGMAGRTTVLLDRGTKFDPSREAVRKGVTVMAIGLHLGPGSMRASTVMIEGRP